MYGPHEGGSAVTVQTCCWVRRPSTALCGQRRDTAPSNTGPGASNGPYPGEVGPAPAM